MYKRKKSPEPENNIVDLKTLRFSEDSAWTPPSSQPDPPISEVDENITSISVPMPSIHNQPVTTPSIPPSWPIQEDLSGTHLTILINDKNVSETEFLKQLQRENKNFRIFWSFK